jgi:hypothetical protein
MEQNLQITTDLRTHLIQPLRNSTQKKMSVNHTYVHNIPYNNVNKEGGGTDRLSRNVGNNYQYSLRNNPEERRHLPQSEQSAAVPEWQIFVLYIAEHTQKSKELNVHAIYCNAHPAYKMKLLIGYATII